MNLTPSRRGLLAGAAASLAGPGLARAARTPGGADPRFLIVLCGTGGCSIVDSFLAVRESESANGSTLNAWPDQLVQSPGGGPFRAIDFASKTIGAIPVPFTANQSDFVKRHGQDMMVATYTGTSVNHGVAEHRSVTGNAAWRGRTLQEAVALTYGAGKPIPNVHLVNGVSFTDRGTDDSLPSSAYGERAPSPNLWPLSLDGRKGVPGAPDAKLFEAARAFRNGTLDPESDFVRTFGDSVRLKRWLELRGAPLKDIEGADLITQLMVHSDSEDMPLKASGLKSSPLAKKVREAFPAYGFDPLESQAALAFLLIRCGVASTVTLGPETSAVFNKGAALGRGGLSAGDMRNTPIAFDFSHQAHREVQSLMWSRVLSVTDRLITLLKSEELAGGKSYWDHSLVYVATEFGRSRNRPAGAMTFGSGHDLNNGALIVSPLVNGGKMLGGVDPETLMTYGFDPLSGRPEPGRHMTEPEIFSGIIQALGIETPGAGLPDMRVMRRKA